MDGELIANACEARDGAGEGLQGVAAHTELHLYRLQTKTAALCNLALAGRIYSVLEQNINGTFQGPFYLQAFLLEELKTHFQG